MSQRKCLSISPSLLATSISTISAYLGLYMTKHSIESDYYGAYHWKLQNITLIFPTSAFIALIVGILVFVTLKFVLVDLVDPESDKEKNLLLSRDMQIMALTTIAIYAAFTLERAIINANLHGIIDLNPQSNSYTFFPTIGIAAIAIGGFVFLILFEFIKSISAKSK